VVSKRKSKSREKQGIVEVETEVFNQRDEVVMSFRRTVLVKCREQ
jgi:acyl dehydratase